jgi:hypothetical protein
MSARILFALSAALLVASCGAEPIERSATGNADVGAGLLAVVDGCRIWRISDGSARNVYFANCSGRAQRVEWEERRPCGGKGQTCPYPVTMLGEDE